ncbi:MAG: C10 family peptidase [Bacteroidales bacterium]|nr:C10 family peptidase [Bacteroidales bacterium]
MKHFYLSSILRAMMAIIMVTMGWGVILGNHLSPEEALQAALRSMPQKTKSVSAASYNLVYDATEVYVFARQDSQNGFLVLAANDELENPVLGYSDTDSFDGTNIPTSLQWLLEAYTYQLQNFNSDACKAPSRSNWPVIDPICKTKWDQDSPYNDECPILGGSRSVTGCGATAMAQVMKVHNWPEIGIGSLSYNFDYNGTSYTDEFNFGSTSFDWSNMLNEYDNTATSSQKSAVATLMHACGVASQMSYSPLESSTTYILVGTGLLEYLNYDKSLKFLKHIWFDNQEEWENIIYDQLSLGLPVLYSGTNENNEGHAFVCDGYDGTQYFHINWGWSGYCDGYYALYLLNPTGTGIGGGSGKEGFSIDQSILIDIRPQENSPLALTLELAENLATDSNSYTRNSSTGIWICSTVYSWALAPADYNLGVEITNGNESHFISAGNYSMDPMTGYYKYGTLATKDFPVGEWDVYAAFRNSQGEIERAYCDLTQINDHLKFKVTETKITVEQPGLSGTVEASCKYYIPVNEEDDAIYAGHSYDFVWDITYSGEWKSQVWCCIVNNDNQILQFSEPQLFDYNGEGSEERTFNLTIDPSLEEGTYFLYLLYLNNSVYTDLGGAWFTLEKKEASGAASISKVEFIGAESDGAKANSPAEMKASSAEIDITFKCTVAPFADEIFLAFADPNTLSILGYSDNKSASIENKGETTTVKFNNFENLEFDTTYALAVFGEANGQMSNVYYFSITENGSATVTKVEFVGSEKNGTSVSKAASLDVEDPEIKVTIQCDEAPWKEDVYIVFADRSTGSIFDRTESQYVDLEQDNETLTLSFKGPWDSLEIGTKYLMAVFGLKYGQISDAYYFYLEKKLKEQTISWEQDLTNLTIEDKVELNAIASSGLEVTYAITNGTDLVTLENNILTIIGGGEVSIKATQNGDEDYQAAESVTKTFTTLKKEQFITWNQEFENVLVGDQISLMAESSSGLAVYYTITKGLDIATLDGNLLTIRGNGEIEIEANQEGNIVFYAATPVTKSVFAKKQDQSITWDQEFTDIKVNNVIELNAWASSGLQIIYQILQGEEIATISGSIITIKGAGEITIEASQPGNEVFNEATPITKSFVSQTNNQSIVWNQEIGSLEVGETIELTAEATSGLNIQYTVVKGEDLTSLNGFILTILGAGEITIEASQPGDNAYSAADPVYKSFISVKKDQSIIWNQDFDEVYDNDIITLIAEATSGLEVNYIILDGSDLAEISGNVLILHAPGEIVIEAYQNGNDEYYAASTVTKTIIALAGLNSISEDKRSAKVEGDYLVLSGFGEDEVVALYLTNGILMYRGIDRSIPISPNNTYILVHSKGYFKFSSIIK